MNTQHTVWIIMIVGVAFMIIFTVGMTWGMGNLQSGYDTCLSVIESGNNTQLWIDNECEWYNNHVGGAFK